MFLRWTNEITLETKRNENFETKRPNICITSLRKVHWEDLVRVGNFCRNACASQNMDGVLGLHIVGRTVSFYVMVSPSTHYVMYQLAKIKDTELYE
ncbi:hypothetical protein G6F68_003535 [Rhizopus microsporus]|nr:hypothetical protein G6F67_000921 [Rhizopus microsporus]KAG1265481.1 hypothetical protein G6F68_003535 [Rhizopus microsporus]